MRVVVMALAAAVLGCAGPAAAGPSGRLYFATPDGPRILDLDTGGAAALPGVSAAAPGATGVAFTMEDADSVVIGVTAAGAREGRSVEVSSWVFAPLRPSPDGAAVAAMWADQGREEWFTRPTLTVFPLDGSEPVRIPGARAPAWLPDGRLVYVKDGAVMARDAVGGESVLAPLPPSGVVNELAVSPDGRRLAFSLRVDPSEPLAQVWVMNVDGTAAHPVTSGSLGAGDPVWAGDHALFVRWSSDFDECPTVHRVSADAGPQVLDVDNALTWVTDKGDRRQLCTYGFLGWSPGR